MSPAPGRRPPINRKDYGNTAFTHTHTTHHHQHKETLRHDRIRHTNAAPRDGAKARVLKAYTLTSHSLRYSRDEHEAAYLCGIPDRLQRVQRCEDNPSTSSWVAQSLSSVTDRIAAGSHVLTAEVQTVLQDGVDVPAVTIRNRCTCILGSSRYVAMQSCRKTT